MHQEKYSLTWNAYSDHLRDMMKELMMNDEFADVTLVSEDKKHIKAHRNILCACSPVFKDMVDRHSSYAIFNQQDRISKNSFVHDTFRPSYWLVAQNIQYKRYRDAIWTLKQRKMRRIHTCKNFSHSPGRFSRNSIQRFSHYIN